MSPKVIIYNSVSVDGAIKDFDINIGLHYEVLGRIGADAILAGSSTVKTGIEFFVKDVPLEQPSDFAKPKNDFNDKRSIWVIADSKGILKGLLHIFRRSEYTKDVKLLVTNQTSKEYLNYLKIRNYDFIVAGDDHVDFSLALEELEERYGLKTVVTDTGGILASVLLDRKLVDEVQLLISPQIVGNKATNLFRTLTQDVRLELVRHQTINKSHVLLIYKVQKKQKNENQ
jgi:2,5-diamino-6-(ribosylamino)-4(3H)-pyrimidinone 5'-phosphate reductase